MYSFEQDVFTDCNATATHSVCHAQPCICFDHICFVGGRFPFIRHVIIGHWQYSTPKYKCTVKESSPLLFQRIKLGVSKDKAFLHWLEAPLN